VTRTSCLSSMKCIKCLILVSISDEDAVQCDFCLKPTHLSCLCDDEVDAAQSDDVYVCVACIEVMDSVVDKPSKDGERFGEC
jgi:hypothetical protein